MNEGAPVTGCNPAHALRLAGAAGLQRRLGQLFFKLAGIDGPIFGQAVDLEVSEPHGANSKKRRIIGWFVWLDGVFSAFGELVLLRELNVAHRVVHNVGMNDPQTIDPRRRIRELQAIPERDRTDEQWDELNELEIRTAPGNRESDRQNERPGEMRQGAPAHARRPDRNQAPRNNGPRPDTRPPEVRAEGRPPKRQHRRPKRPGGPVGGNSGESGGSSGGQSGSSNDGSAAGHAGGSAGGESGGSSSNSAVSSGGNSGGGES